ncbi:MAG: hypothetical protein K6G17_08850, partial [Oscillospiraceae bacterium]|nr:hypothetical protein [Oscillospiraceae bacterium]
MKRFRKSALTALLLCALLLTAGCGAGSPAAGGALSVWAAEDSPLADALTELAQSYDAAAQVRLFPSEEALLAALESERPDLIVCGEAFKNGLAEAGRLGAFRLSEEETPRFLPAFGTAAESLEQGWLPLGAELPVLIAGEAFTDSPASLEALFEAACAYGRQEHAPYLGADSFTRLFACAMEQKSCRFYAERDADADNPVFRGIYNMIADAAFDGGLALENEPTAPRVARGELVCAVCSSLELPAAGELQVLPLPPMAGCENLVDGRVYGLAMTAEGARAGKASDFAAWLCREERAP